MSAEARASGSGSPAPALLRGEDLRVVHKRRTVLDVPSVELAAGRTYGLLGASGAGKSTLLRVLGLLERPTSGRVFFEGVEARYGDRAMRQIVTAVFQRPYLLRGSVADNVGYGLRMRNVRAVERADRISATLARVGLAGWESRSALTLSGGEAQRVALARALVLEPRVLLLDEPLSYMDPLLKRSLTREFARILASEHVTALYVTHDQDEAAVVADRIGVMREGRIVAEGEAFAVLGLPGDEWLASFLGMETPIDGIVEENEGGLARIRCGGLEVFAVSEEPPGAAVQVAVRPEDVLLFEPGVRLPLTSARNHAEATVVEVAPQGATARVVLESGGARLAATVSAASVADMRLSAGSRVTAMFKATAVRVSPAV